MIRNKKQRVNFNEKRNNMLLFIINLKNTIEKAKMGSSLSQEINTLEIRVKNAEINRNNPNSSLATEEKMLAKLDKKIGFILEKRVKKATMFVYTITVTKALISIGAYFLLIPQNRLQSHPLIYIACSIILFTFWLLYFSSLLKFENIIYFKYISPFIKKYPKNKTAGYALVSFFQLITFQPLLQAINILPQFINPTWENFLFKSFDLIIQISTSNYISAILNIIAFGTPLMIIITKLTKKLTKKDHS